MRFSIFIGRACTLALILDWYVGFTGVSANRICTYPKLGAIGDKHGSKIVKLVFPYYLLPFAFHIEKNERKCEVTCDFTGQF